MQRDTAVLCCFSCSFAIKLSSIGTSLVAMASLFYSVVNSSRFCNFVVCTKKIVLDSDSDIRFMKRLVFHLHRKGNVLRPIHFNRDVSDHIIGQHQKAINRTLTGHNHVVYSTGNFNQDTLITQSLHIQKLYFGL